MRKKILNLDILNKSVNNNENDKNNEIKKRKEIKKNNSSSRLLPFFILLLFIILNLCLCINSYTNEKSNNQVVRLHVIANSNSIEDQITKLKVYSKIDEYIKNKTKNLDFENSSSISNVLQIGSNNQNEILEISNNVLNSLNKNYDATLKVGKIYYDKKQSVLLDMDKGNYPSIEIILGNGEGKNIWSLISPNQKNIQSISNLNSIMPGIKEIYKSSVEEDIYNTSKNSNLNTNYKLKILELLNN